MVAKSSSEDTRQDGILIAVNTAATARAYLSSTGTIIVLLSCTSSEKSNLLDLASPLVGDAVGVDASDMGDRDARSGSNAFIRDSLAC